MKIEVAESLLYSWMRHVKDCKIVQTNWKVSSKWKFDHIPDLEKHMSEIEEFLMRKYRFDIFKKNASLNQLVNQGECDVIGINVIDNEMMVYAADVAFHRAGLNYGENIQKVSEKLVRTAFCIYGFTGLKNAEIIFACPKISDKQKEKIKDCVEDIQKKFNDWGFEYSFKFIANEDFFLTILEPVRLVSSKVEDTGELFMRSLQLLDMFYGFSSNDERLQDKWSEKMKPDEASSAGMGCGWQDLFPRTPDRDPAERLHHGVPDAQGSSGRCRRRVVVRQRRCTHDCLHASVLQFAQVSGMLQRPERI